MRNLEETFGYDSQNRLTGVWLNLTQTGSSAYDSYGRMTAKTADGQPVFSNAVFNTTAKPHAMDAAATVIGVFPATPQTVTYTGFDKVSKVKQGNDSLCYTYGYDHQRIFMEEHVGNTTRTKRYVGNCEFVTESDGSNTSSLWRTFVAGPYGVFAVVESRNGFNETHNVLKDNLGSWTTITDGNGTVEQRLSYDVWGNLRNPNTWANYTSDDTFDAPMFDRGFTGHEHLTAFGLVNMNGRVYDPSYTQNFNRYAYCMNNPLKYTDPDGEWAHLVIGALVGGIVNLATNWGHINTFGEGLAYFGIGAAAGALSAGVGLGVSSWIGGGSFGAGFIGSTAAKTAVSSFASGSVIGGSTGFTQGFITGSGNSWMQESTFGQGLLQGIYSGAAGLVNGAIHGGISGGLDAMANGRKFWSGDYVETISRDYPVGPNYTQPDGSKDCVPTVAKTIDPMSCGVIDYQFWDGFAPYEGMTCEELDVFSISKIYKAFSEGADIPITIDQGIGNDYHELLIRKMEFRIHQEWFSGNINTSYQSWVQDPAIGYMLPKVFNFDNVVRVFILKPLTP